MSSFENDLNGKVVVLTGGTSGFGYEMVKGLLAQGCRAAVFSVDELTDERRTELNVIGGEYRYYNSDLLQKDAAQNIVGTTIRDFGGLDHLIANAGFALRFEKPLLGLPLKQIEDWMNTQFSIFPVSFTKLSVAAAREMRKTYSDAAENGFGHPEATASITVVLSEAAICPLRDDLLAYAAAKKACLSVMQSLAGILGAENIRVNGIAPGFADTEGPRKFYSRYPEIRADIGKRNHLKPGFMHPAAVWPAVKYLMTDNYVTGEMIALDGGYHLDMMSYFQNE